MTVSMGPFSVDIYKECFELSPTIFLALDARGTVLEINQKGCTLLGYSKSEIVGKEWFRHFLPEPWRAEVKTQYLAIVGGKQEPFGTLENPVVTRNGEERLISWYNTFLRDENNRVTGAISSGEDITECRRYALERDRFFNLSIDMLCISDFDGCFRDVNPACSRTLGWSRQELFEHPWMTLVHPDDLEATEKAKQELVEGASVLMFNNRCRCKDGTYKWISWDAFPLPDERLIFAVARDISERRAIEQQLRESQDQLHHFEKLEAVGRLAGGVAHDFNNQLASIMGCADLLHDALCEQSELRKYTEIILSSTEYSAKLTNQLLAFARKGKYRSLSVDLHQIIDQVLAMLSRSVDKRIRITTDFGAFNAVVKGDPTQLQNAFLNVALNARDAMPTGGILHIATTNTQLSIEECDRRKISAVSGGFIKVTVTDTGTGMDGETQSHIFEPFYSTKNDGKGRGLGLASVYGTVTNHNGSISVSSALGKGSAFTFLFPLDGNPSTKGEEKPKEIVRQSQGTVLLVDDEQTVLEAVQMMLQSLQYNVITCTSGPDALVKFQERPDIDFVILDLVMPDWNGIRTFGELRKVNPGVKVLLSSGYSIEGDAEQLLSYGASGFLKKPFRKQELLAAITPLAR